jgi:magnesium transporter
MNFKAMPELNFHYGYPMALGVMICSAVLPYQFFKSRGWL